MTIHVVLFVFCYLCFHFFFQNKVTDEGLRTENFDLLPSVIVLRILLVQKLSTYTIFIYRERERAPMFFRFHRKPKRNLGGGGGG